MAERPGLLIVDVQNDFCAGGALEVKDGDAVVPVLNDYAARFHAGGYPVYASRDWHPPRSKHFAAFGGIWPVHCVQHTPGAAFHPELRLPAGTAVVSAGTSEEDEGYSAFEGQTDSGTAFGELLQQDGVDHLYVGGLATDYCVSASALDARRHGLRVTLLADAIKGVNLQPGDSERAIAEMRAAGIDETTRKSLYLPAAH